MELELVSFKICPFVQRAVITLRHKQTAFNLTHIDLSDLDSLDETVAMLEEAGLL